MLIFRCFGGGTSKSDQEEDKRRKEANKRINAQIQKDKQVYRATHRLLLLGKKNSIEVHFIKLLLFPIMEFNIFTSTAN